MFLCSAFEILNTLDKYFKVGTSGKIMICFYKVHKNVHFGFFLNIPKTVNFVYLIS